MTAVVQFLKRKLRQKRLLFPLVAITLICCLAVISGLNKPHMAPFSVRLQPEYPTWAARSDSGYELIDNESRRLLILNQKGNLTAVVDTTKTGSPITKLIVVTAYEDRIFVIGTKSFNHGRYLSSESIIEYDRMGNVVQTVYSETHAEADKVSRERFVDLYAGSDGLYLTKAEGSRVSLIRIDTDSNAETVGEWTVPEAAYTAGYMADGNYCFVIGLSTNCYAVSCETGEVTSVPYEDYLTGLMEMYGISPEEVDLAAYKDAYCIPAIAVNGDGRAQYYCLVAPDGTVLLTLSGNLCEQYNISAIPYSAGFLIKVFGYWLAVFILGLELLVAIILLVSVKGAKDTRRLLFFIGIALLISLFYTSRVRKVSEKSYVDSLQSQAKQISYMLSEACGDIFREIGEKGAYSYCIDVANQQDINRLRRILKNLCDANDSAQTTCFAECHVFGEDGTPYIFADSSYSIMSGQPIYFSPESGADPENGSTGVLPGDSYSESLIYAYEPIRSDDGTLVASLLLYGYRDNLAYMQTQNVVNMTVSLLALLVGVYTVFTLSKAFSTDLRRRKAKDPSDAEGRSLDMTGILSFSQGILYSLDAVIIVYVAKSLCVGMSPSREAFLVSLPIATESLGKMIGTGVLTHLRKRFGERSLSIHSAIGTLGSMLFLAFSVFIGNIYLYIAGSFIKSFFLSGMLYGAIQTIPYRADSEDERVRLLNIIGRNNTTAAVVSALISGYIAQYLSYTAVYIVAAALSILVIFLCSLSFVKQSDVIVRVGSGSGKDSIFLRHWGVLFRGPGLVYILCYFLPWMITGGYKSYLFPLYSANAGFSALLLSNLTVFVQTVTLIVGPAVFRITNRMNRMVVLMGPPFLVCACLICFILSPNVYWAIVMMVVYEVMQGPINQYTFTYLNNLAEENGLDPGIVYGNSMQIHYVYSTVRTPILSAAVTLGMNYACTVVGAACAALYGFFLFFEKKLRKKKEA